MEKLFYLCVDLLYYIASITGLTYEEVNVIIFCFIWPALTVYLAVKAFTKSASQSSYQNKSYHKPLEG
jgi:hypothetical protein